MSADDLIFNIPEIAQIRFLKSYREPHRFFHTENHIYSMLEDMEDYSLSENEKKILRLAIIYHDCVYNPKSQFNEKDSAEIFKTDFPRYEHKNKVVELIMATKSHVYGRNKLENIIIELDLAVLNGGLSDLLLYEDQIFKEYQFTPIQEYIKGRVDFLTKLKEKTDSIYRNFYSNIDLLIDYVQHRVYKIGIFPGSFNPFHKGHENIKLKAEQLFDKVIIARGINPNKDKSQYALPESLYNETIEYNGLVTVLFENPPPNVSLFLIRGLRNVYDLGYEETLRKTIHDINPDIQFSYFFCARESTNTSVHQESEVL